MSEENKNLEEVTKNEAKEKDKKNGVSKFTKVLLIIAGVLAVVYAGCYIFL